MSGSPFASAVRIHADEMVIPAVLASPPNARAIIAFSHDPKCSNRNPRNRLIARALFRQGFAVLLPDLSNASGDIDDPTWLGEQLEPDEYALRLLAVIDWIVTDTATKKLPVGVFGDRAGAAAAIIASVLRPRAVRAVVARGGSLEPVESLLPKLKARALMILGDEDLAAIDLDKLAYKRARRSRVLEVVREADEDLSEHGNLDQVSSISCKWFQGNLKGAPSKSRRPEPALV